MAGRKTKLTPELIAQAEKLLRAGNYVCVVADYLGISEQTWYDWIKKGENGRGGLYLEFTEAIKRAMPVAEIGAVAGILQAAKDGNWQAFAWFLERKFSDRWGRKEQVKQELTGKDGHALLPPSFTIVYTDEKDDEHDKDTDEVQGVT